MTPSWMNLLVGLLAAMAVFFLVRAVLGLLFSEREHRRRTALERLKNLAGNKVDPERASLLRPDALEPQDWLRRLLGRLSPTGKFEMLLYRAGIRTPPAVVALGMALALVGGFAGVQFLTANTLLALGAGVAFSWACLYRVQRRAAKRMALFQRQLPDALDLAARALRAGHSFNSGLKMVADESPDPIGPEFRKTLDEINFGLSVETALYNLVARVDCPDLKFFVVSVNIQRETGGNLAEIVTNIAALVRERFKLQGKVRVLSAEGRLSAWVLTALPFLAAAAIFAMNPEYLTKLLSHPVGRQMLMAAGIIMAFGIFVIKRLVIIKV
jgi:tight adherence protein B